MKIQDHFLTTVVLSNLAYESSMEYWSVEKLKKAVEDLGFENFEWIENPESDTQCFLCSKGEYTYLTFRGSSTEADWYTNFDISFILCRFGRIHKGFSEDAKSVKQQVQDSLIKHIIKKRKLIITGHSQGADVACSMAIELLDHSIEIEAVIHYGGARLVDFKAAIRLDKKYPNLFHRVVNNNDVVTRIAPRLFGYRHFGQLHYFKGDGTYTTDISAWERFLDRMKYKFDFGGEYGIDIFNDHAPDKYVALVKENFEKIAQTT